MTIYGYCRVSTQTQADAGQSLNVQEQTIRGYAVMKQFDAPEVFVERGVSGSIPILERPEGGKLFALLKAGDVIITPKLDRMFRSSIDALSMLQKCKDIGAHIHMIDLGGDVMGEGVGKLVFSILSAVAEAERDRIRERIREAKKDQKKRNMYLGGAIPFGSRVNAETGELEPDEKHELIRAYVKEARRLEPHKTSLRTLQACVKQRFSVEISLPTIARCLVA